MTFSVNDEIPKVVLEFALFFKNILGILLKCKFYCEV